MDSSYRLEELYSPNWSNDPLFLAKLSKSSKEEVEDLILSEGDFSLASWYLTIYPPTSLLAFLFLQQGNREFISLLLDNGDISTNDIEDLPLNYWLELERFLPLREIGKNLMDLLEEMDALQFLVSSTLYELLNFWADNYKETELFYPEDLERWNQLLDKLISEDL